MPNTRDLRRRIKSIKNTSQITRAMQMVSATKMRRAQNQTLLARPYTRTVNAALWAVSNTIDQAANVLLAPNGSNKIGVLLLSTDKGLCGALNTNLIRVIQSQKPFLDKKIEEIAFYSVGKKGRDFIVRSGKKLEADFDNVERVEFSKAVTIRKMLVEMFLKEELGEVYILYPHFDSTLRQVSKLLKILPIGPSLFMALSMTEPENSEKLAANNSFLFEPNASQVLDYALTHLLDAQIYQALLETKASEHSARMMAMQNATDNASELVDDLNLTYNQLRQGAITKELLEITSAGAALE